MKLEQSDVFENDIPRFMEYLCKRGGIDRAKEHCHNDGERALLEVEYGDYEAAVEYARDRLYDCEVTSWELYDDQLYVEVSDGEFEGYHSFSSPRHETSHINDEGGYFWNPTSIEFTSMIPEHDVHTEAEHLLYRQTNGESAQDAARAEYRRTRL